MKPQAYNRNLKDITGPMSDSYTLYGAPMSMYTGKTRAYLRFKQIPFNEVFSSFRVYKKIIVPKTGVQFIPVVETPDGDFVQDTSVIMDVLENKFAQRSVVPSSPQQTLVSALFEMWADEWLLLPAMHYRWNHDNFPFIYEEFGKVVLSAPLWARKLALNLKALFLCWGSRPKLFLLLKHVMNNKYCQCSMHILLNMTTYLARDRA